LSGGGLRAIGIAALSLLAGCSSIEYLLHSAGGHLEVMAARRPIPEVVADPATPEALARRLEEVERVRDFAEEELALPAGGSYRSYADIGRDYVVYSVVAAPTLSLAPRTWCYPVAGCLSYRGYFDLARAGAQSDALRSRGFDVYVAPVQAYSTLGWFDDPLLNTLLRGPTWHTAGVVFHELAHQRIFVAHDTAFNEAYAVAVQEEGERRWLARHGDQAALRSWRRFTAARAQFLQLVREARAELEAIYASADDDADKLAAKERALRALRGRYANMPARLAGYRGLDRWFGQDLNNAKLALVSTYNDLVPRFAALIAREGGDMAAFHRAVETLAERDHRARRAGLPPAPRGDPGATSAVARGHRVRLGQAAQCQHAGNAEGGPQGQHGKHRAPAQQVQQRGHQLDGQQGEQEAEAGLQGEGGADVARIRELAHCGAELGAVGDHLEAPAQAQRRQQQRMAEQQPGRQGTGAGNRQAGDGEGGAPEAVRQQAG
jgi:predicted aminopeptidase